MREFKTRKKYENGQAMNGFANVIETRKQEALLFYKDIRFLVARLMQLRANNTF